MKAVSDFLSVSSNDAILRNAFGLVAGLAFITLYVALRLAPKRIGA